MTVRPSRSPRAARCPLRSQSRDTWLGLVHVALLVVAGSIVFANTLRNSFHLDDFYRVVDNPGIQTVSPVWRHFVDPRTMSTLDRITQYRPLLPLTLSLNYRVGGYDPVGYHLLNLLLQVVAGILVYALALELATHWAGAVMSEKRRRWLAFLVALLFEINPVSGILVNYVSSRDLLLMQVFLLGSLLAYVRLRRLGGSPLRWLVALAFLLLALLSKTNAVVAPLLVLAFELTAGRESPLRAASWLRALPFALAVAAYLMTLRFVLHFSDLAQALDPETPWWQYAATQARLQLVHYARNFVWPFAIRQEPLVERMGTLWDPGVALGIACIVATLVIAWRLRRSAPVAAFCILAYWILMLPESSVIPLYHLAVDYRPYPGSPFLFLAVAVLLGRRWPRGAPAILLAAALYLGTAAFRANRTWRTEESLWTHSVRHGGDALAHMNLAMSIADRRDPRVRANLEAALRMNPNFVLAHVNYGLLLVDLGNIDAGLAEMRRAVQLAPSWSQPHYWLGQTYTRLGRPHEAAAESGRAADLDPGNLSYQYQAALDAQNAGDYEAALRRVGIVERMRPDYEETQFMKGFVLEELGRLDEAIVTLKGFLARHPNHVQAEFDLGYAFMRAHRCSDAVPHFQRVLVLQPAYAAAHLHLSTCFGELGDERAAAEHRAAYQAAGAARP